ncbi:oligopeptide transporter 7-like protein [Neoconidiobolus thromboides FSU 785]|nr:oligopeptide transporter 7-like protein [Neoconidiobolus thromboides FSU 785]
MEDENLELRQRISLLNARESLEEESLLTPVQEKEEEPFKESGEDDRHPNYDEEERTGLLGADEDDETSSLEKFMIQDDITMPTLTFRFWILSLFFGSILAFTSQFFFFRATPLTVGGFIVQLLTYPIGLFLAKILPEKEIKIFNWKFSLNPGKFNVKEHCLITVAAGSCASTAYAMDIIVVKKLYYKQPFTLLASFLLLFSSQFMGYGFAGIYRKLLVKPRSMIWPSTLVSVSLFRALHEGKENLAMSNRKLKKFFIIMSLCSFFYYFLPGYLFTFLSSISILCLIFPNSIIPQQLGSGIHGLGLMSISLDWNSFTSYIGSPLVTPFWAQLNTFIGFVIVCWILVPLGYYFNIWDAQNYPIFGSGLYDIHGNTYDRSKITPNNMFSEEAYQNYSPLRLTFFFSFTYGISFATLTSLITHTILYHGKEIYLKIRSKNKIDINSINNENENDNNNNSNDNDSDIHNKLMSNYSQVPTWWYFFTFIISFVMAIVVCEIYDLTLPWWGLILAVVISFVFTLPIGIVTAITNQSPGLNVLTEFIAGYLFPGYPIANVTFKVYGFITMAQALNFLADLKLGHYLKIPPKSMFIAQCLGTLLAIIINLVTAEWLMSSIPNICTKEGFPWTCPSSDVFYSASVIWGLIGPEKMFGLKSIYNPLLYSFIIGLILPIPFYLIYLKYPNSWVQYIHIPVIISATAILPPARPGNFLTWIMVGFIFHIVIQRYYKKWYDSFHLILSAALDTGVAFAALLIFFIFELNNIKLNWWGNTSDFHCPLANKALSS